MLTRIQALLPDLSKSERRVGEWILANPLAPLAQDTRSMAALMDVSQPTLVRFARSMGCEGFQDFRIQLARSYGEVRDQPAVTLQSIGSRHDVAALADGLFDFTARALMQVRQSLDQDSVEQAIATLDQAGRVDFFGFGQSVCNAQDAARRFMRLDMQVAAHTDAGLQSLAARHLRRGDALVLLSQDGRAPELAPVMAHARNNGALSIGITTRASPLRKAADIALCVDVPDSGDALTPGTAQLAQSLVLDLLSIGVATRRSARIAEAAGKHLRSRPQAKKR